MRPATLEQRQHRLARAPGRDRARSRLEDVVAAIGDAAARLAPPSAGDPRSGGILQGYVDALRGDAAAPDLAAQVGAGDGGLEGLLATSRRAHAVVRSAAAEVLRDHRGDDRISLAATVSERLIAHRDLLDAAAVRELSTGASVVDHRLAGVREVLDGRCDSSARLGYELATTHFGLVATGPGAANLAERSRLLAGGPSLFVSPADGVTWGWIAGDAARALAAAQALGSGAGIARLAMGDALDGAPGFRDTHAQARAAHALGRATPGRVVAYDEVALEALVMGGTDGARKRAQAFAARELGALDPASARDRALLQTAAAYLAAGQNAAAAGARLGVHDQTVTKRVRALERRIGRPLRDRSAELQLAVRITLAAPARA